MEKPVAIRKINFSQWLAASRENMLLKYFSLHVFLHTWKKLVTLRVILLYLLFFCWAANMSPDVEKVIGKIYRGDSNKKIKVHY